MPLTSESWYFELFTILIVILICCWIRQWIEETYFKLPPGPFRWPLLGNIPQLYLTGSRTPHETLNELSKKYGDLLWLQTGGQHVVVASGFENLKQIFKDDDWLGRTEHEWQKLRTYGKPLGLFISNELWHDTRRLVMHQLRDYGFGKTSGMEVSAIEEIEDTIGAMWKEAVQNNGIVYPYKYFRIPGVNVTWSSVSGKRFDHQDHRLRETLSGLGDYTKQVGFVGGLRNSYPFMMKWFPKFCGMEDLKASCDMVVGFLEREVAAYKKSGSYKTDPQNFIESYLKLIEEKATENDEILTEEMLVAILFDLLWAANDSTAGTMEYTLLWLTLNPEAQAKLRQELLRVVGTERRPSLADKPSLSYTKAVILEIHRRSGVVPLGPRDVRSGTEINGLTIPGNTPATLNLYGVMMDEDFWQDPENFRPERFLTPEGTIDKTKSERVIPFTMGKRNCIGEGIAECILFLFVTSIIQEFRLSPCQPAYDLTPLVGIVCSPKRYSIKLEKTNV